MAAEWVLQQALYSTLSGDATLSGLGFSVVDHGRSVADGSTRFPYVEVGEAHLADWDTDTTDGFDVLARIHSYANTGSLKLVKQAQAAIYAALHHQALSVSGYQTVLIYREDSHVMHTSKGAHHGICEYRILLVANA